MRLDLEELKIVIKVFDFLKSSAVECFTDEEQTLYHKICEEVVGEEAYNHKYWELTARIEELSKSGENPKELKKCREDLYFMQCDYRD